MSNSSTPALSVIGLDIGERATHWHEIAPDGEIFEGRHPTSPAAFRRQYRRERCRIALEVCSHSRWIYEELVALGHEVLLLDPRKLKLISGSLIKDDRRDAERIASLALEAPKLLVTVKVRPLAQQQALTLVRGRAAVVRSCTLLKNAVRGLLKPYGVKVPKSTTSASFVRAVRSVLPDELWTAIEPMLESITTLADRVKGYDKAVVERLQEDFADAVHLTSIHGVGALTVLYFAALIGDPHRFTKARSVGSYLGLTRRKDDSGDRRSALGITKAGDPLMRSLLGHCATYILGPFGRDCDLRRWGMPRLASGDTGARNRTRVAVARKLAVTMLAMWKTGDEHQPLRQGARHESARAAA
jgi:transposase